MSDSATAGGPRERQRGEVLWYSEPKGWGVVRDARGREVPVDYAAIAGEGFRSLRPGQPVELELREGPCGPVAERVVPLGEPAPPLGEPAARP